MAASKSSERSECWVDIFSEPDLQGRMLRLRSSDPPKPNSIKLRVTKVQSLIVGPGVRAKLKAAGRSKPPILLNPCRVVSDLSKFNVSQPVMSSSIELVPATDDTSTSKTTVSQRTL
jgi:hypothetical protein